MSAEAPLEVFYRIEAGEVKSLCLSRLGLPEFVHQDHWEQRPFQRLPERITRPPDQKPR